MLVLFTCCWGSNWSIQAKVGKFKRDLLQPSRIRYEVWSFSVIHLLSIAYCKGLISGVKLSVVVPQAIGISLRNSLHCTPEVVEFPHKSWNDSLAPYELCLEKYILVWQTLRKCIGQGGKAWNWHDCELEWLLQCYLQVST